MKIKDCKVNHIVSPVGYRMEYPVFSWKVHEAKGIKQDTARIRVSENPRMDKILFDSDYSSELDSMAAAVEIQLQPRTRYYWDVAVRTNLGEEASSEVQFFETGKREEAWLAKWITCSNDTERHPIFKKQIRISQNIQSARLYICGLGLYEAYIGDERIGNEYLTPYCNDYHSWLQYQTYDVTSMLNDGCELNILLGNGWYKGRYDFDASITQGKYGDSWKLIAELHIDYKDGTHQVVVTDDSWQIERSSLTFSNIYDGEQRDDTLVAAPIESSILAEAPEGQLTERMSTPVTIHEELQPVLLVHTPAGEQVLDMGQNFAGSFRLKIRSPKGTKIHLQFGEILQNGNFYRDNLRSAKAEYIYIADGIEKTIMPHFTFYGYRFVKIEGFDDLKIEDFTGVALYSEIMSTGKIETGSDLVNQLISNTEWGQKSNFIDVPTDCPQRDERLGWTGDAQVFSATACYLKDCYAFYAKYLYDMAQEQKAEGGSVPQVIPSFWMKEPSSVWGDAACIIPWTVYRFYGDKSILSEQFESMKAWVDFITKVEGEHHAWGSHFHFGDWLALDNTNGDPNEVDGATDKDYIAYVYYMASAKIVSDAAGVIGKTKEQKEYLKLSNQLYDYIKYEYFTGSGRCSIATQTALLLALKYDLTSDREWTKRKLIELFAEADNKLQTGFVGTPLLCIVLSENGMDELAYKLLLNEDYPGWLYAVKMGATTIWERWNSVLEDGSISGTGMNSLNHYSYGSITEWLFAYAAGIRQDESNIGFRKIILKPVLNWELGMVKATFDSPLGKYEIGWKIIDETHVEIEVTVPFGGEAYLTLPFAKKEIFEDKSISMFQNVENGVCVLTLGTYKVKYETSQVLKKVYSCDNILKDLMINQEIKDALLESMPGLDEIPKSYYKYSLRKLALMFAGQVGLPDVETITSTLLPQIDALLLQIG
jgi:alpha-L-rhamnosidase